jgi:hypothetical protein
MMTTAEESLLKLALTSDWTSYERSFAQVLAERSPEGRFLPADNSRVMGKVKYKTPVHTRGHFKYQFEVDGSWFNAIIEFYTTGDYLAVNIIKAGINGGSTFTLNNGSKHYVTTQFDRTQDLSSNNWQNCVDIQIGKVRKLEEDLPYHIAEYIKNQRAEEERTAQQRERRALKKAAMKIGVFHKHNVRSTPETELLFSVVSRLGTEQSVSKAFGDLLPLITGELIDGNTNES